jgi:hypothetical protein
MGNGDAWLQRRKPSSLATYSRVNSVNVQRSEYCEVLWPGISWISIKTSLEQFTSPKLRERLEFIAICTSVFLFLTIRYGDSGSGIVRTVLLLVLIVVGFLLAKPCRRARSLYPEARSKSALHILVSRCAGEFIGTGPGDGIASDTPVMKRLFPGA